MKKLLRVHYSADGQGISPDLLKLLQSKLPATPPSTPRTTTAASVSGIPGFAELAKQFPGGPSELQKVLNDPQVLEFIRNNPDIVRKIVREKPSPDKLQALLALAAPPPEGAEVGVFGAADIFAGT